DYLQGEVDHLMKQFRREQLNVGCFRPDIQFLIRLPSAQVTEGSERLQLAQEETNGRRGPLCFFGIMTEPMRHRAQNTLRHAMGANADLESSGPTPRLIELPPLTDFAKHLVFWPTAIREYRLAWLGDGQRRETAP